MPPGQALATNEQARAVDGRAVTGAVGCPCCGGCTLWFRALQCFNPFGCVAEPAQRELSICRDEPCVDGGQLSPGTVDYSSRVCWTIQPEPVGTPPPGADIYPGKLPVICVGNCTDLPCPQGE